LLVRDFGLVDPETIKADGVLGLLVRLGSGSFDGLP
jgi:hypothetical protein